MSWEHLEGAGRGLGGARIQGERGLATREGRRGLSEGAGFTGPFKALTSEAAPAPPFSLPPAPEPRPWTRRIRSCPGPAQHPDFGEFWAHLQFKGQRVKESMKAPGRGWGGMEGKTLVAALGRRGTAQLPAGPRCRPPRSPHSPRGGTSRDSVTPTPRPPAPRAILAHTPWPRKGNFAERGGMFRGAGLLPL